MIRMPSILLPLEVVSARTGRSVEVLRRWCVDRRIPAYRVEGDWYVPEPALPLIEAMPKRTRR
jgi:hypothetical protein